MCVLVAGVGGGEGRGGGVVEVLVTADVDKGDWV